MKKRLEQLARMRGTSMQDTIKFALMSFVEMQERQAWFLNATVPVEVESEEGVEEVQP
jgi:predicted transcriptional regulator